MNAARRMERQQRRTAWIFLLPLLLTLMAVAIWPLARSIFFSFTDAYLDAPSDYGFVGIENFVEVAEDPVFWGAVRNTLVFTLVSVGLETLLGLAIALLLHRAFLGRGIVRAAILIPWAMPMVVSARIWEWMLNDQFGLINKLLVALGLVEKGVAWTADPSLILGTVIFIDVWVTTPFMVLLILAGLQLIPEEIYEAADVSGVPQWKRFWSITLPLATPAIGVAILFRTLDALRMFDLSYVLAANNENTMTMSIYARDQLISFQDLGLGAAASTWVFMIIGLIAIVIVGLLRLDRATG
ncbi:carbohydrate ABC transporter permease [Sinorhizobium meliloti]|uniref:Sugar uptake ABC transporter permease protein n=2 Tax=Rhizobium meliloti TaxID=382 RepID=Q92U54_RHIME|nr:sugar ABC transporter permease [Sinorhizobium meliloti]TWA87925.1 carbohydrate ABC transporter membrane protein 1 (CUT1 family) [Ensifer sp. SEMIA 134]TWB23014.1 carbohydrate ABC transporter membrane protein 1 (CUT1 family) [Ensifer sp. SEMIA 135]AEG56126.1 ABC-type transporter, integral membrane subunit [Sinorhizobium meliloti AK83]AGG72295.1 Putative sugar uptake ABC transporter permease [Sinorhizobium meliloti 2011]ASP62801.1 sugar ABC transporter permease [Sinorhizobium meliloti]